MDQDTIIASITVISLILVCLTCIVVAIFRQNTRIYSGVNSIEEYSSKLLSINSSSSVNE